MAGEDQTEAATPRRLQRAREEGSVPISREVPALAGLGAATLTLAAAGPTLGEGGLARLGAMLAVHGGTDVQAALVAACLAMAALAAPVVFGVLAASVAASMLQTGFFFNPAALRPDLARLNPARGFKRIFGVRGLVETAKAVAKLAVLGYGVFHVLSAALPSLAQAVFWLPGQLAGHMTRLVTQLALTLLGAQAVIAGADTVWVRHQHAKQLRMSKEEVKQETKEADGNPQVKQRLRQIRMARARKRMLAAVPKATVVVTNPTHYAIALAYDRSRGGAPRVVAKGVDDVAARIREVAQDNRVPLVANPPLARALYTVELDAEIPPEHFKVVAEIIAYVCGCGGVGRGVAARTRAPKRCSNGSRGRLTTCCRFSCRRPGSGSPSSTARAASSG